jgi:hypothetical protein
MRKGISAAGVALLAAVWLAGAAWAAEEEFVFSKTEDLAPEQAQEMLQTAQAVVGDQVQVLDEGQAYLALDAQGKPFAYFILAKEVPDTEEGGVIALMSLQTTKNPKNMMWMWGEPGGKNVHYQKLQPKGSKAVGMGYGPTWCQGQQQQGHWQVQRPVQCGWPGKGKIRKGKLGKFSPGVIVIRGKKPGKVWKPPLPPVGPGGAMRPPPPGAPPGGYWTTRPGLMGQPITVYRAPNGREYLPDGQLIGPGGVMVD